jgi:predicted dehydrogenase
MVEHDQWLSRPTEIEGRQFVTRQAEPLAPKAATPELSRSLNWGILGTGAIAKQFAAALARSRTGSLTAVASRGMPATVAPEFAQAKMVQGYDALLADPAIDAVYIATPNPTHARWAIRACEAGKHVLCEKPIGINQDEARSIIEAGRRHNVLVMEGYMYRCHPQTRQLIELLKAGIVGDIQHIHAVYGNYKAFDPNLRHFSYELGGGAILDVGGYCVSMSRLVAGVANAKPFVEPEEMVALGRRGASDVDEQALCLLRFPGNVFASLSISIALQQENIVRIYGTKGRIEIPSPWFCSGRQGGESSIVFIAGSGDRVVYSVKCDEWLYSIEIDTFAASVAAGTISWPATTPDDTLGTIAVMDRWRNALGVRYASEAPGDLAP